MKRRLFWNARKAVQWRLHALADWVVEHWMLPSPLSSRRGALALRVSNGLDKLAAHIGGHTW